jgi:hypothetical protein
MPINSISKFKKTKRNFEANVFASSDGQPSSYQSQDKWYPNKAFLLKLWKYFEIYRIDGIKFSKDVNIYIYMKFANSL